MDKYLQDWHDLAEPTVHVKLGPSLTRVITVITLICVLTYLAFA